MRQIHIQLPSNHEIVLFGCTHEGSVLQHEDGIQECKEFIMSKRNRYTIHGGDAAEWRMVDHPYYDASTVKDGMSKPQAQLYAICRDFSPIRNRLLCMIEGNHEFGLQRWGNMTESICRELSSSKHTVLPGTAAAVIHVSDKHGLMYKMFATHGGGVLSSNAKDWEQRQANMKASLKLRLQDQMGDCLIMAMWHTHRLLVVPPSERLYITSGEKDVKQHYLHTDGGNVSYNNGNTYIDPERRWYVNGGSFMKLYKDGVSGYAERRMLKPVELGFANLVCRDRNIVAIEKKVV